MENILNDQLDDLFESRICGQYIIPPILYRPNDHLFCIKCLLETVTIQTHAFFVKLSSLIMKIVAILWNVLQMLCN